MIGQMNRQTEMNADTRTNTQTNTTSRVGLTNYQKYGQTSMKILKFASNLKRQIFLSRRRRRRRSILRTCYRNYSNPIIMFFFFSPFQILSALTTVLEVLLPFFHNTSPGAASPAGQPVPATTASGTLGASATATSTPPPSPYIQGSGYRPVIL